jgi:hypothetical protein
MKLPKVFLPRPLLPMSTVAITANNAHNKGRPKEEFENLPGQLCDVKDMECNRRDALNQVRDPPRASMISEKHIALSWTSTTTGDHTSILMGCGHAFLFGMW